MNSNVVLPYFKKLENVGEKAISKNLETVVGPIGKKLCHFVSCSNDGATSADSAIISTVSDLRPADNHISTGTFVMR